MNTPLTQNIFSDFDMMFEPNIKGDVSKKLDLNAIKQSVKNIVLMRHRPFNLFCGPGLYEMLFENFDPFIMSMVKKDIEKSIRKYEPRVTQVIVKENSDYDNEEMKVSIYFKVRDSKDVESVSIVLSKLR